MVKPSTSDNQVPTIDFGPYLNSGDAATRKKVASQLAEACHEWGCCGIVNHGLPPTTLSAAFDMSQKLFALPEEEKMKAPHPEGLHPHRGYSKPGMESAFSREQAETHDEEIRDKAKVFDYKEHYEIGSEESPDGNIWLPESVLPGFRQFELRLHAELAIVCDKLLEALLLGLEISEEEIKKFHSQHDPNDNHLRLLHYPPIEARQNTKAIGRCAAHQDYGSFTILFQNDATGLEFQDRKNPDTFVPAVPAEGKLFLNIADILEIFSKGYYHAAIHRVTVPNVEGEAARSRYSIPYFIQPRLDERVEIASTGLPAALPAGEYESTTFREHLAMRSQWQYDQK